MRASLACVSLSEDSKEEEEVESGEEEEEAAAATTGAAMRELQERRCWCGTRAALTAFVLELLLLAEIEHIAAA